MKRIRKAPKPSFREYFYARFPNIPRGQFGIPGEHYTEALNRFMATLTDYLDETA